MQMVKEKERVTFTSSIDRDLKKDFNIYCALHGKYQNEVIEDLIRNLLDNDELLKKSKELKK